MKPLAAALLIMGISLFLLIPKYNPSTPEPFDPDFQTIAMHERPQDAQLVFLGDSLTERWRYHSAWKDFADYHPANLGVGGEKVGGTIWRVEHGALDGIKPKWIVVLIGTNDIYNTKTAFYKPRGPLPQEIAEAIARLVTDVRMRQPQAKIILMDILPRDGYENEIDQVNRSIARIPVSHLSLAAELGGPARLGSAFSVDGLHLTDAGYEVWAKALEARLR